MTEIPKKIRNNVAITQTIRNMGSSRTSIAPSRTYAAAQTKPIASILTSFAVTSRLSRERIKAKMAPKGAYGIRKVMLMIMTSVEAVTILATSAALPGYGASSSLSQLLSHVVPPRCAVIECAMDAILLPANYDYGRLTNPKQVCGGILHFYANRIARRKVHPIECPLDIRQPLFESPNFIRIRSYAKSDTVDNSRKAGIGLRHHIDVGPHSGCNML